MKTLIVEDDFTSRTLLAHLLRAYGPCDVAVDGRDAVDAVRSAVRSGNGYDLICLDIMMPELDGQATLREIRSLEEASGIAPGAAAKVIMTSSLGDPRTIVASFKDQCDAYLKKPYDKAKLLQHLTAFGLIG